jgi:DNA-directed RNA polymerase specialized sigma24 family protein
LTKENGGYARLLARLDGNLLRAEAEFERLRATLTRFFDWRGVSSPEDCADETLERLAHKLEEGVAVLDVTAFARGVARLVLQEAVRAQERVTPLDDAAPRAGVVPAPSVQDEPIAAHLDQCLEHLPRDARQTVLAYYGGGNGRGKIDARRRLAGRLRLSDNALRSRVKRLRDELEDCMRARSAAPDGRERRRP